MSGYYTPHSSFFYGSPYTNTSYTNSSYADSSYANSSYAHGTYAAPTRPRHDAVSHIGFARHVQRQLDHELPVRSPPPHETYDVPSPSNTTFSRRNAVTDHNSFDALSLSRSNSNATISSNRTRRNAAYDVDSFESSTSRYNGGGKEGNKHDSFLDPYTSQPKPHSRSRDISPFEAFHADNSQYSSADSFQRKLNATLRSERGAVSRTDSVERRPVYGRYEGQAAYGGSIEDVRGEKVYGENGIAFGRPVWEGGVSAKRERAESGTGDGGLRRSGAVSRRSSRY